MENEIEDYSSSPEVINLPASRPAAPTSALSLSPSVKAPEQELGIINATKSQFLLIKQEFENFSNYRSNILMNPLWINLFPNLNKKISSLVLDTSPLEIKESIEKIVKNLNLIISYSRRKINKKQKEDIQQSLDEIKNNFNILIAQVDPLLTGEQTTPILEGAKPPAEPSAQKGAEIIESARAYLNEKKIKYNKDIFNEIISAAKKADEMADKAYAEAEKNDDQQAMKQIKSLHEEYINKCKKKCEEISSLIDEGTSIIITDEIFKYQLEFEKILNNIKPLIEFSLPELKIKLINILGPQESAFLYEGNEEEQRKKIMKKLEKINKDLRNEITSLGGSPVENQDPVDNFNLLYEQRKVDNFNSLYEQRKSLLSQKYNESTLNDFDKKINEKSSLNEAIRESIKKVIGASTVDLKNSPEELYELTTEVRKEINGALNRILNDDITNPKKIYYSKEEILYQINKIFQEEVNNIRKKFLPLMVDGRIDPDNILQNMQSVFEQGVSVRVPNPEGNPTSYVVDSAIAGISGVLHRQGEIEVGTKIDTAGKVLIDIGDKLSFESDPPRRDPGVRAESDVPRKRGRGGVKKKRSNKPPATTSPGEEPPKVVPPPGYD